MRKPKVELRAPRKVWRITPEAPQGEFVEFVESEGDKVNPVSRPPGAAKILTDPPPPNWRASSYDLMTGLEVQDFSDTVTSDVFDELFPSGDSAWDQTAVLKGPAKKT
jgi:hypothetical protein